MYLTFLLGYYISNNFQARGFDDEDQTVEENDEGYFEDDSSSIAEDEDAYEEWGGFGGLPEASHTSLGEAETSEAEPEETLPKPGI
jgi:hypothetical protein